MTSGGQGWLWLEKFGLKKETEEWMMQTLLLHKGSYIVHDLFIFLVIKGKSGVPLGECPTYIATYTTTIYGLYIMVAKRANWGNLWGTTARVWGEFNHVRSFIHGETWGEVRRWYNGSPRDVTYATLGMLENHRLKNANWKGINVSCYEEDDMFQRLRWLFYFPSWDTFSGRLTFWTRKWRCQGCLLYKPWKMIFRIPIDQVTFRWTFRRSCPIFSS